MVELGIVDFFHSSVQLLYFGIKLYLQCKPFFLLISILKRKECMSRTFYFRLMIVLNSFEEELITFDYHGRVKRINSIMALMKTKHFLSLLPLFKAFACFMKIFMTEVILQRSLTIERSLLLDPLLQKSLVAVGELPLTALLSLVLRPSHKSASV